MELERDVLGSPAREVPVVEGEVVLAIRALADCGVVLCQFEKDAVLPVPETAR